MINAAIVDDDPEFLEIMAHELEKTKFFSEIKTSSDPQQFLAQLHQDSPDVLFLDIEMPEINGFFVAQACRKLSQPPFIIYVTADEQYMAEAFGSHVIGFLVKSRLKMHLPKLIDKICEETARNHVSTLEVQTAEKPVTMRVCGQVQIVNWGLFYPVVLPNFHGLNFAGKWL